jgi:hypothetical protein
MLYHDISYKAYLFAVPNFVKSYSFFVVFHNSLSERDFRLLKFSRFFYINLIFNLFSYKIKSKNSNLIFALHNQSDFYSNFLNLLYFFFRYIPLSYWLFSVNGLLVLSKPLFSFFFKFLNINCNLYFFLTLNIGNIINYSKFIECY